jgi:hypothetical protein
MKNNYYGNDKEVFAEDIRRIFENAKIYNQKETIYYKSAVELLKIINPILSDFLKKK